MSLLVEVFPLTLFFKALFFAGPLLLPLFAIIKFVSSAELFFEIDFSHKKKCLLPQSSCLGSLFLNEIIWKIYFQIYNLISWQLKLQFKLSSEPFPKSANY